MRRPNPPLPPVTTATRPCNCIAGIEYRRRRCHVTDVLAEVSTRQAVIGLATAFSITRRGYVCRLCRAAPGASRPPTFVTDCHLAGHRRSAPLRVAMLEPNASRVGLARLAHSRTPTGNGPGAHGPSWTT